jgi:hypothetical protein
MKRSITEPPAVFSAWIDSKLGLFPTSDRLCGSVAKPSVFVDRRLVKLRSQRGHDLVEAGDAKGQKTDRKRQIP